MNKTAAPMFVFLVVTIYLISIAIANPVTIESYTAAPDITINSPLNQTYSSAVLLNFSITASETWLSTPISFSYEPGHGLAQQLLSVDYYLDGKLGGSIPANTNLSEPFCRSFPLMGLKDGNHSLIINTNSTGVERDWACDKVYYVPAKSSAVTINFALNTTASLSQLELKPVTEWLRVALVAMAIAAVATTATVVYLKRRNR